MVNLGDNCPECGKGVMKPTGERLRYETNTKSEFGTNTGMECDKCGYKERKLVRGVNE